LKFTSSLLFFYILFDCT